MTTSPLPLLFGICLLSLSACSTVSHESRSKSLAAKSEDLPSALMAAEAACASGLKSPEDKRNYANAVAQVVAAWQTQKGQPSRQQPYVVKSG
ncbi:MAG: hypothetical protein RL693_1618, partial [Verrucomicrobiota bacterium]